MTPFGIRKKLKSLLGLSRPEVPEPPPRPKYTVHFLANDEAFEVESKEGDSLVLASGRGAYPIATGCSDGTCGTCRVEVLEGIESITKADEYELRTKAEHGIPDNQRLGCHTAILGAGLKVNIVNILGEELVD